AMAVHPISALQSEYSLFERGVEAEVLPACRELGIGFVPYSPLGRGLLTGKGKSADQLTDDDNRRKFPRFQGDNFEQNRKLAGAVEELGKRKSCTPAQIALAWLLHQGPDIVPIPGTKRRTYLRENLAASDVHFSAADIAYVAEHFPPGAVAGERYHEGGMQLLDQT